MQNQCQITLPVLTVYSSFLNQLIVKLYGTVVLTNALLLSVKVLSVLVVVVTSCSARTSSVPWRSPTRKHCVEMIFSWSRIRGGRIGRKESRFQSTQMHSSTAKSSTNYCLCSVNTEWGGGQSCPGSLTLWWSRITGGRTGRSKVNPSTVKSNIHLLLGVQKWC